MARVRNTGMILNESEDKIIQPGSAPILMEPVKAVIHVPFSGKLNILDHDGKKVIGERSFRRSFGIDGAQDHSPFYFIRRK